MPKRTGRRFWMGNARFVFNNEERIFSGDWNEAGVRKLWLYNLHYMSWLFDLDDDREEWMRNWIRGNPFEGKGNGWEPYPTSLRIFNWCRHFILSGSSPPPDILASLERQSSWLLSNLEFHLDGNHLLENLFALAYVGLHLDLRDGRARHARDRIRRHLEISLAEQFLADGGHFELSPMYHSILLERILDLVDVWPETDDPFPGMGGSLRDLAGRGADWLEIMSVGGRFALFNDACYDAAPDADRLLEFAARLLHRNAGATAPVLSLADSGYFRAEAGDCTLIFDAGRLGPDHQMGHAQGDMLSFCLWMRKVPVLVHPGNYEYVQGPMRDFCRSTAAHNTLVIDGCEQADWWASHRVGWRGRPSEANAERDAASGLIRLRGSHDGFSRLPGRPLHRRTMELSETGLEIRDELTADPGRSSRIYFHFHPDCTLEVRNGKILIRCAGGSMEFEANHPVRLEESWYCPEFGLRIRNRMAVVEATARSFRCNFTFTPG